MRDKRHDREKYTYTHDVPNITPLRPRHIETIRRPERLVLRRSLQHARRGADEGFANRLGRPFCFDLPDAGYPYH